MQEIFLITRKERSHLLVAAFLSICNVGGFHLQLQLVRDQRDKLRVGGLAFRVPIGNNSTNKEKARHGAV